MNVSDIEKRVNFFLLPLQQVINTERALSHSNMKIVGYELPFPNHRGTVIPACCGVFAVAFIVQNRPFKSTAFVWSFNFSCSVFCSFGKSAKTLSS